MRRSQSIAKRNMNLTIGDLVLCEWEDSHHRPGWTSDESEARTLVCQSVGWLVAATKDVKVLSANITQEDEKQRCGDMTIPQRCIRRLVRLSEP
jgi:hypothetical protein